MRVHRGVYANPLKPTETAVHPERKTVRVRVRSHADLSEEDSEHQRSDTNIVRDKPDGRPVRDGEQLLRYVGVFLPAIRPICKLCGNLLRAIRH